MDHQVQLHFQMPQKLEHLAQNLLETPEFLQIYQMKLRCAVQMQNW